MAVPSVAFRQRHHRFSTYLGVHADPFIAPVSMTELSDIAVLENQACARKVDLAADMFESCVERGALVDDLVDAAASYVASEIAPILGCSKTVADSYVDIGLALRDRLPAIRTAFGAGTLDLARVRVIHRCTGALTPETATAVETDVLHAARRLSPGPLATEIWSIMHRLAPEEAAALRKDLEKQVDVRYREKDVIASIVADLPAADAAASWQLIDEMAATVCPRDPRSAGQKRAAAYVALLHQESSLACLCESEIPCTANPQRPDRRKPLTEISIDLATLAGLLSEPAHLVGHGTIDADYARELAADTHWQLVLTEARDLAEKLGHGDALASLITRGSGFSGSDSSGSDSSGSESNYSGPRVFHPLGRGRRRTGGTLPRPESIPNSARPSSPCTANPYRGTYTFIAELEGAIAADPALGKALHPDGHGGFAAPPPGALVYRPSDALAQRIRHRDRTCRHPGCDTPARRCDIDHVVPYSRRDPATGGWTVETNLHCLCRYHHDLKTLGLWTPAMLTHGIVAWTSASGTRAITVPGTTRPVDLTHLPAVHRKPRGTHYEVDSSQIDDEPPPF